MLMGIRPDRMQALAWGLAARRDRHRRRADGDLLIPRHGRARRWTDRVRRRLVGGFGSVPGAMYAGLIIGLIQALSAFFGPIYKDIVVFILFVRCSGSGRRA